MKASEESLNPGDVLILDCPLKRDSQHEIILIQKTVAKQFGITFEEITGDRRPQYISEPRQIAMFLSREKLTELGLSTIGKAFNRDHGTIIHAVKTIANRMSIDTRLQKQIDELRLKLAIVRILP